MTKTLVLYYSPTCFHCTMFMPVWNNFVKQNKTKIQCKMINAFNMSSLKNQPQIMGVPEVRIYNNGKLIKNGIFTGERTVKGLNMFIKKHTISKRKKTKKKSQKKKI